MKNAATLAAFAACLLLSAQGQPSPANAATTTYTDSAAYFAAAGHQTLQDFNSPISTGPNNQFPLTYPNLFVSCSGSSFCNNQFGGLSGLAIDGYSVFVTSPSVVTFTFNSPITSFGIYIAGLGTVQPGFTDFSIANSNGFSSVIYPHYAGFTTQFDLFAGLISDTRFTSVSLWGTEIGDGILLDNLNYGQSAVPIPGALSLFGTGLGLLGLLGWRGKKKLAA